MILSFCKVLRSSRRVSVVVSCVEVDHVAKILSYGRRLGVVCEIKQFANLQISLQMSFDGSSIARFWKHVFNIANVFLLITTRFIVSLHFKHFEVLTTTSFFMFFPERVSFIWNRCAINNPMKRFVCLTDSSALIPIFWIFILLWLVWKLVQCLEEKC